MTKQVKILLRILAPVLFLSFLLLGATLENGFCMGESIMIDMGLSPWSEGTEGYYYPGVIAVAGMFGSLALFACTTQQKARTFRRLIIGIIVAGFLIDLIYALVLLI